MVRGRRKRKGSQSGEQVQTGSEGAAEGWVCSICGGRHGDTPVSYAARAPDLWYAIPEEERGYRCLISADQCVIDGQQFFLAGCINIPIVGRKRSFSWAVWVSLAQADFDRASELWETPGRESEPPYAGRLSTELPAYPSSTLNLKAQLRTRPVGFRPYVELEPSDHPLAVEQRDGISWRRVQEIAELVLHRDRAGEPGQE
jgi:hypothetical protein